MKTIHYINLIATSITLALYLLLFYGMMAQIVLGPLQLDLAIIISLRYYKLLDQHHQIFLLLYCLVAILALIIAAVSWAGGGEHTIIGVFVIPMLVAYYFLYVTKRLNNYLLDHNEP